jgi:hypothetical protein
MKTKYLILSIIAFATIVAILTNPTPERHKEVVKNKLHQFLLMPMVEGLDNARTRLEEDTQSLEILLGNTLLDNIIDNLVSTDNFLLFSTTKISLEGKSKTIGYGVFGNVFLAKELDEAMNEALNNVKIGEGLNKKKKNQPIKSSNRK